MYKVGVIWKQCLWIFQLIFHINKILTLNLSLVNVTFLFSLTLPESLVNMICYWYLLCKVKIYFSTVAGRVCGVFERMEESGVRSEEWLLSSICPPSRPQSPHLHPELTTNEQFLSLTIIFFLSQVQLWYFWYLYPRNVILKWPGGKSFFEKIVF